MSNIVDLSTARLEKTPHMAGTVVCLVCGHEHQAVVPVGTVWLECPACHLLKAAFRDPCRVDVPHWTCACGNDLFHVSTDGTYCPHCGAWLDIGDDL